MGGRQAWRRWLSAVSVVRRRSTTTGVATRSACCVLRWRHASSSASTERPSWTSPPAPDVSAPAIYNHFGGKVELLVAAARWELARLAPGNPSVAWAAPDVVRAFLSPRVLCRTCRLLAEIHVAAARYPELAALLAEWHAEQALMWVSASGMDDDAVVKSFFALLLGLCHLESLSALPASPSSLEQCAVNARRPFSIREERLHDRRSACRRVQPVVTRSSSSIRPPRSPRCASSCPVHHTNVPAEHYTLARGRGRVRRAARRRHVVVEVRPRSGAFGEIGAGVLVSSDPLCHTAERLAISRAFKPSVLEGHGTRHPHARERAGRRSRRRGTGRPRPRPGRCHSRWS